jgi:hypothetical protein
MTNDKLIDRIKAHNSAPTVYEALITEDQSNE